MRFNQYNALWCAFLTFKSPASNKHNPLQLKFSVTDDNTDMNFRRDIYQISKADRFFDRM